MRYALVLLLTVLTIGCVSNRPRTGQMIKRSGDEIMVCGQLVHTGAPVVLWTDPGGYDAYRVERRFVPWERASWEATTQETKDIGSPNRYGLRFAPSRRPDPGGPALTPDELERFRGGGWDLKSLQDRVDQFVYHYDVCGVSRQCFKVLHDSRDLSVHFMLDVDGTIYQTLDLKERAWHATIANSRSIGIEIANIGAYGVNSRDNPLDQWYPHDSTGKRRLALPIYVKKGNLSPDFVGRPIREEAVVGEIQNRQLRMYDLTPQQYDSLTKLTAALCKVFPKIKLDYPKDEQGQ